MNSRQNTLSEKTEINRIITSFIPGMVFVFVLWLIKFLETKTGFTLSEYGVLPRTWQGVKGILFSPLVHGDYKHLLSNSIPLIILGSGLFYFYRSLAWKVFLWIYLLGGFWLWLGGRESYHIGASGLVYGLTAFLFFSGVLRRDTRLMAFSLLVVFLYGGMVWGIFPLFREVSWEAHLFGLLAGILMSVVYRREGPQRKLYAWELEPEVDPEEEDDENAYWKIPAETSQPVTEIQYEIKSKSPESDVSGEKENKGNS